MTCIRRNMVDLYGCNQWKGDGRGNVATFSATEIHKALQFGLDAIRTGMIEAEVAE